jgi:hypothetical protein
MQGYKERPRDREKKMYIRYKDIQIEIEIERRDTQTGIQRYTTRDRESQKRYTD